MKNIFILVALIIFGTVLCIISYKVGYLVSSIDSLYKPKEAEVLSSTTIEALVNNYRINKGLNPLKHEDALCEVATRRSGEIEYKWKHPEDLNASFGYPFNQRASIGENLAKDYKTIEDVINSWLKSTSHLENIESTKYGKTCVAVKDNNFIVQVFSSDN